MSNDLKNRTALLFLIMMLFTLLGTLLFNSSLEVIEEKNIFGLWKGENNGKELMFRFENNGTCVLSFKDIASDFSRVLNGNFKIDLSKKPIPLSIINIPNINHPLHTIVEFMGNDSIIIASFSPRSRVRPILFDLNTSINLNRIK